MVRCKTPAMRSLVLWGKIYYQTCTQPETSRIGRCGHAQTNQVNLNHLCRGAGGILAGAAQPGVVRDCNVILWEDLTPAAWLFCTAAIAWRAACAWLISFCVTAAISSAESAKPSTSARFAAIIKSALATVPWLALCIAPSIACPDSPTPIARRSKLVSVRCAVAPIPPPTPTPPASSPLLLPAPPRPALPARRRSSSRLPNLRPLACSANPSSAALPTPTAGLHHPSA